MKKTILFIFLILATLNVVDAQVSLKTEAELQNFEQLPSESVYLHFNTSVLFVGEYLYYQFYCLNTNLNQFSELSKLGYVELIGKNGEVVFKHKIVLKAGLGNGDFFIPTSVSSGSYKLIAYTSWMRNGKKEVFFKSDITIINPYNGDDSELISKKSIPVLGDTLEATRPIEIIHDVQLKVNDYQEGYPMKLNITKEKFTKREKVVLKLVFDNTKDFDSGNYSLSVRRKNTVTEPLKQNAAAFIENSSQNDTAYFSKGATNIYLPELRGELISGWVSTSNVNSSVKNIPVGVSIPGERYFFKVLMTDAIGKFHFNKRDNYSGDKMIFQVLSPNAKDYKVQLRQNKLSFPDLEFNKVELDSSMNGAILERSIHNQIENAFYTFRPDSLKVSDPIQFLENKEKKVYILDEYTRFKTVDETIVEILSEVSTKRVNKDQSAILIQGFDNVSSSDLPSLVLLDGCFIQNHDALLEFDARKIKTMNIFRHQFIFGSQVFRGALIINTNAGTDYTQFYDDQIFSYSDVVKLQLSKRYFTQRYDSTDLEQKNPHLPDDRLQLLWLPQLKIDTNETIIEFFTSDVIGSYEILLEGFTKKSKPVSVKKTIVVK